MSLSKKEVLARLRDSGVIPVFYHPDIDVLLRIVSICYNSGLRVFEFMHQRDNRGLRFFVHLIDQLGHYPDTIFGVGTVLDATMTGRYIDAGAQFIASPFLRSDMAQVCNDRGVLWMPGCATAEEVDQAVGLDAEVINVLPGNILGPEFIAPLARKYPDVGMLPSGISDLREQSLVKWFESGAMALKIGPQIFTKDNVSSSSWMNIAADLKDLLQRVRHIQSNVHPIRS